MLLPDFNCADVAYRLIDAFRISIPILDIDSVVRDLGGFVVDCPQKAGIWESTIYKTGKDSFCIHTVRGKDACRRTSSIVHDLGHLYLHMGFRTDPKQWDSLENGASYHHPGPSLVELEANEFARCFLMPEEIYRHVFREYAAGKTANVFAIAQAFNVTISAALNRGRCLGLLR